MPCKLDSDGRANHHQHKFDRPHAYLPARMHRLQVSAWLLPTEAGTLEAEGIERTYNFKQEDIVKHVEVWAYARLEAYSNLCGRDGSGAWAGFIGLGGGAACVDGHQGIHGNGSVNGPDRLAATKQACVLHQPILLFQTARACICSQHEHLPPN